MNLLIQCYLLSIFVVLTYASDAEYIPKSYYVIDKFGRVSNVVSLRNKRAVDLISLLRAKRSPSSGSSSGSYSGSSSKFGPDNIPFDIPDFAGAGFPPGFQEAAKRAFHQAGFGGGAVGEHISVGPNPPGPALLSRFGEGVGGDVGASSSAIGQRGAFSSSSTSVDSDGNVKYSVKAGKY